MIRLTFLLRRRSDLTLEEFQDYWLRKHGPLVAGFAEHLRTLRYVQVHTLDDPVNAKLAEARGGMEPPYDGVAEMHWTSRQALEASTRSSAAREAGAALLEDEARFIDLAASPLWLGYEYPQVSPPGALVAHPRSPRLKLYFPLRHTAGHSLAEAQGYWHTQHGPMIRAQAPAAGIERYIQVHRTEHLLEAALRKVRGTEAEPYTGHAELWLGREALGAPTPEARAAARRAIHDERRFIDFKRSAIWVAKEHVLVDHTAGRWPAESA